MDFFEQQAQARTRTGWLVALFALAVVLIVAVVYLAAVLALRSPQAVQAGIAFSWWDPSLLLFVAGGVGLVVGVASGIRTLSLRQGGPAIAEMMGGRAVLPNTDDPDERRLRNVVEEMALASGVPVPVVYVLTGETAINAFAAGYGVDDAVVAVTDGALRSLTRDELQGVVAHEFSHLLNKDSRINIRLTGLLFGILALGVAGRLLLRGAAYSGGGKKNQGALVALAVGLALFVTGYLGVLFGRIIRAAVSRQREVLADASAVQFTRNPAGLASALKKIAAGGSTIQNASSEEISHFFFANAMSQNFLTSLWATHPPLEERIRRLDPSFDKSYEGSPAALVAKGRAEMHARAALNGTNEGPAALHAGITPLAPSEVTPPIDAVTPPSPETVPEMVEAVADGPGPEAGAVVLSEIPDALHDAVSTSFGAVATLYALMLDPDESVRTLQLEVLEADLIPPLFGEVVRMMPEVGALESDARLPLADVAAPALRQLSPAQAERFSEVIGHLARIDGHLSIFEFALETILQHRLAHALGTTPKRRNVGLDSVLAEAITLLSAIAHVGTPTTAEMQAAFRAGLAALTRADHRPVASTSKDLHGVLDRIGEAKDDVRAQVVEACVRTVLHDRTVTRAEGHLLRAIAIALDAPLPSFLPRLDALVLAR